ncbi:MAG: hypothetical protein K6E35_01960 [Bacteroidales bacterium]|nr:hypothetical protein [Bacteroidales bacterium]
MESENKLTPRQSLELINETLDSSRRAIVSGAAKFFLLWGGLFALFSLAVWLLWSRTGNSAWNWLWFAMPVVGEPIAALLSRGSKVPQNYISLLLAKIWGAFGFFALATSLMAFIAGPMNLTMMIILLFGVCECISGIVLKNWPIIVAGAIVGLGGVCAAAWLAAGADQILLFTGAAVVLALTGLAIKFRK